MAALLGENNIIVAEAHRLQPPRIAKSTGSVLDVGHFVFYLNTCLLYPGARQNDNCYAKRIKVSYNSCERSIENFSYIFYLGAFVCLTSGASMPCVVEVEDVELGDKAKFRGRALRNDHFLEALAKKENVVTAHSPQGDGCKYMKFAHMAGPNPFVSAVHLAFAEHLPLRITPDQMFLTIIQGISAHVARPTKARKTCCSSSQ
jgi:Domain of unknown function (DUF4419)